MAKAGGVYNTEPEMKDEDDSYTLPVRKHGKKKNT